MMLGRNRWTSSPWRAAKRVAFAQALLFTLLGAWASGGPIGEQVVRGDVTFSRQGDLTLIEASNNSIIKYSSFDIAGQETVRFIQPGATARVLNRIDGATPTRIEGSLLANGFVYLVNPAGVYFGKNAIVDVAGIYAAGASMSNSDFLRGIDRFTHATGDVVNRGAIQADTVALIGRTVANYGSIVAERGTVMMVAGDDVYFGKRDGHLLVKVEGGAQTQTPAVKNEGAIQADQGTVLLGAGDMYSLAIQNTGIIKANDVTVQGGKVQVSGSIDASNPAGTGGTVKVLGSEVALTGATIDASGATGGGTVLIGGDYQGANPDVPNATVTYVDRNSTIDASALLTGGGGKVVVWSNDVTAFYGRIVARGGRLSGDGGFAEVSSGRGLVFRGTADLGAGAGLGGRLLLDPASITVQAGGADDLVGTPDDGNANILAFTEDPAAASVVDATAVIDPILQTGTTVELQAHDDITIDQDITGTGGTPGGGLTLRAGDDVHVNSGRTIALDNGALLISVNDPGATPTAGAEGTPDVDLNGTINTGGGGLTINMNSGGGTLTLGGGITAGTLSGDASLITVASSSAGLQQAIDLAASSGAVITVNNGLTFNESLTIQNKTGLTLMSPTGGADPILNLQGGHGIEIQGSAAGFTLGGASAGEGLTINATAATGLAIVLANAPSGVTIQSNTIDSTANGGNQVLSVGAAGAAGLSVTGNVFTAGSGDWAVINSNDIGVSSLSITNNTFNGPGDNTGGAIQFMGVSTGTISGNVIDGFRRGIVLNTGTAGNSSVNILSNEISNTDLQAIWLRMDGSGTTTSVAIENNTITGADTGILIDADGAGTIDVANVSVARNSFSGSTTAALTNSNATQLDAGANWWGDASGPYNAATNASATGDAVSSNVAYSPWLADGTDDAPGTTGFQPVSPMTFAMNTTSTIQTAIGYLAGGDTLSVPAGTYAENVNLNLAAILSFGGTSQINDLTTSAGSTVHSDGDLTVNGTADLAGSITTSSGQLQITGATTISGIVSINTVSGATGGAVLFGDGAGDDSINAAGAGGPYTLTVNTNGTTTDGNVTLRRVGNLFPLDSLTVTADTGIITLQGATYDTTGDIAFGSTVTLTADTAFTTGGGVFNAAAADFTSDASGPWDMSVDTTGGSGGVAGNVRLYNFDASGGTRVSAVSINANETTTDGNLELNGTIGLDNHVTSGTAADFGFTGGDVIVKGNSAIHTNFDGTGASGSVSFGSSRLYANGGSYGLGIMTDRTDGAAGNVTLALVDDGGGGGGNAYLSALGISAAGFTTDGTINLTDNVTVAGTGALVNAIVLDGDTLIDGSATTTLDATGSGGNGIIALAGTLQGAAASANLTLDAGTGTVNIGAPINTNIVNVDITSGILNISQKITATGNVVATASGPISITAGIDPAQVTMDSNDDITISAAVSADDLIRFRAGQDGTGSFNLNPGGSLTTTNAGSDIELQSGATTGNVNLAGGAITAVDIFKATANGGSITQTLGSITAASADLTGNAGITIPSLSVASLTAATGGGAGQDIAITEANGLTALDLNAGAAGNVALILTLGALTDADASTDITANAATVVLADAAAQDFGALANPIGTSVNSLNVGTSAGGGNQYIAEANGLTALSLDAGAGNVDLTLTLGGVSDTDGGLDIVASAATVLLSDATAQDFGALANPIGTSVNSLSVDTSAGGGSQYITEANGLAALNLNAGAGNATLRLALGALSDTDGSDDITANAALVILFDPTAQDVGALANRIGTSVNSLSVDTSPGGGNQYLAEANGLTDLYLNAGAGNVDLVVSLGAVSDADGSTDVTGGTATVVLSDGAAQAFGALASPIGTSVNSLNVDTSAGGGNQFITEANGLTALSLNAGAGNPTLTLTLGALSDTDASDDITGNAGTVILSDPTAQNVGALANRIGTNVNSLSVVTSAGYGSQYLVEANGLTALDLSAGTGNVDLVVTLGAVSDADVSWDITAATATVALLDGAAQDFGALANPIGTSVNSLNVSTAGGGGSQYITETNGLTALNLNAGAGNASLTLTLGALSDTDAGVDITAGSAAVMLSDAASRDIGSALNPLDTDVNTLATDTSAGGGSQYIADAGSLTVGAFAGLTGMKSGGGDIDLNAAGSGGVYIVLAQDIDTTGGAGGTIRLRAAVSSLTGARSLLTTGGAVQLDSTLDGPGSLTVNPVTADVYFGGDIGLTSRPTGLSVTTTGNIELNSTVLTNGAVLFGSTLASTPDVATIYKQTNGNVLIDTNGTSFTMGNRHKFTVVNGNLTINAGAGTVTLGDLTVNGSLLVNSVKVVLQNRPGAPVRGYTMNDAGVDIVVNGNITMNNVTGDVDNNTIQDGPDRWISAGGVFNVTGSGWTTSGIPVAFPGSMTFTGPNAVRDLEADRGYIFDPTALASAIPRPVEEKAVPQIVVLSPALRELLEQLGIFARDLTPAEQAALGAGGSVEYNDIIRKPEEEIGPEDYTVPASRLPDALVKQTVDTYRSIFWKEGKYQGAALKSVLQKAFDAYKAKGQVQPGGFRKFLETTPDQADALKVVNGLKQLFEQISYLGLTDAQQHISEGILVRDLVPTGMTGDQLIAEIKGVSAKVAAGK